MEIQVSGRYLAVPVWTNRECWDRYELTVKGLNSSLFYTFKLPAESGDKDAPDYYTYLPMLDCEGNPVTGRLDLDCDAPYPVKDRLFFTDTPAFEHEPDALHYHAPYGSLNDPNGLVYYDGLWHMYHQHNPFDNVWGNMSWGHSVSKDLIHFSFAGDVLFPDNEGVMFSGCGLVNERGAFSLPKNALLFFYTLASEEPAPGEAEPHRFFTQRLAYSLDNGYTLIKYPEWKLDTYESENRDPKIFWHNETSAYIMSLFLTKNRFAIFRSEDLKNWTKTCEVDYPPMWECPDLLRLSDEKWAFMSADGFYFIGSFDGFSFKPETEMKKLYANDMPYAAQSYSNTDGRIISVAWLRTGNHGENWHGMMSVPRELSLGCDPEGYYIRQSFVPELSGFIKENKDSFIIEDEYIRETLDKDGHMLLTEQLF